MNSFNLITGLGDFFKKIDLYEYGLKPTSLKSLGFEEIFVKELNVKLFIGLILILIFLSF